MMVLMYSLHLQVHMESGDHSALIDACVRWGDTSRGGDPQLWLEVLDFFAAQPTDCATQARHASIILPDAPSLLPYAISSLAFCFDLDCGRDARGSVCLLCMWCAYILCSVVQPHAPA